jgi:hypothetical protein
MKWVSLFIFMMIANPLFATDRCDGMFKESCGSSQSAPDGTGLLGSPSNKIDRKKLYNETISRLRVDFENLIRSDPDLKKQFSEATFFDKNDCVTENCVPPTAAQKMDVAFKYVSQRFESLNPDPPSPDGGYVDASFSKQDLDMLENRKIRNIVDKASESIYAKVAPDFQRAYLKNTLFPDIKVSALKVLARLPDGPEKTAMINKIKSTSFVVQDCDLGLLEANAFYDKGAVNYCYSMMYITQSAYSEVSVIAHELGHSVDPCVMPKEAKVWRNLASCLRRPSSIGAKILGKPSLSTSCSPNYEDRDQLGESFADWFSAEILNDVTKHMTLAVRNSSAQVFGNGISNVMRPVCSQYTSAEDQEYYANTIDEHPNDKDRIELLLAQPGIRARMGCSPKGKKIYCDIDSGNSDQIEGDQSDQTEPQR